MKAIIFCSGVIENYAYLKNKSYADFLVICADGGVKHTEALNITPDIIIGDEDSSISQYPDNVKIIKYPTDKDFTDTHLCIDYAIGHGCDEIELLGATGGRLDHEFSHFCLLSYGLSKNIRIKICDEFNEVWMENKSFTLNRCEKKYVSFFPYGGDIESFTVRGLKYEAENMYLSCSGVQASSNEFVDTERAEIEFHSGTLLVMLCDDKKDFS